MTRPTVARTIPLANAVRVDRDGVIRITFSEPVRGVSASSIRLVNVHRRWVVKSRLSYLTGHRVVILDPVTRMYPGTAYRVEVHSGVTDLAGNPVVTRSWVFRTGAS